MSQISDIYDDTADFETLLNDASASAVSDFEIGFVNDMNERFQKYGDEMYLSTSQREALERIAKQ